uniref:Leucine-rich repeat domain-containing protein n=1 Tax=viral metagenome TaxID=1070528 RepID=A0A6C0LWU0_9ZZZZ
MDEYLKLKEECCQKQKKRWNNLIEGVIINQDELIPRFTQLTIESEKQDLFRYYVKLMQSLDKIPDKNFVNIEYSKMFEKMIDLAEFNGGTNLGIRYFQVRRGIVIDSRPAFIMAIMGPGSIGSENIIDDDTEEIHITKIQKLYFGRDILGLEPWTCSDFKKLRNVYFHPDSECYILGAGVFEGCSSLKEIIIPNKVVKIATGCFYGCGSLKNVIIGQKVEELSRSAFQNCQTLKKVHIPDSVKLIEEECFKISAEDGYEGGLVEITGMKNVEELGHSVFVGTEITNIKLGPHLKKIGRTCFMGISLTTITLEYNDDLEIDYDAFNNLDELTIINLLGGNTKKWVAKLKGQFMDCWKIHMLSERYQEQIEKIRIRNDFKWDISDEVIYIAYARILEQEAMQLMKGGSTNVQIPQDISRYIAGFSPKN